jgi:hypothetical protein
MPFMREGVAGLLCDETRKLSLSTLPGRGSVAWSSRCSRNSQGDVMRWVQRVSDGRGHQVRRCAR